MLSRKPWQPESVLQLAISIFFCVISGSLLAGMIERRLGPGDHPMARVLMGMLSFQGAMLVLIGFFLRRHRIGWRDAFGFRNNWRLALAIGCLCGLIFPPIAWPLQGALAKLLEYVGYPAEEQLAVQILRQASGWPAQSLFAIFAIVLAPMAEEMFFRGILYTAVKQIGFPRAALWSTSLFFAAIHFNLPSFLPLLLLALALTWLYEKTDNLLAPIVAHSLFNAANFAMLHFADKLAEWHLPHP